MHADRPGAHLERARSGQVQVKRVLVELVPVRCRRAPLLPLPALCVGRQQRLLLHRPGLALQLWVHALVVATPPGGLAPLALAGVALRVGLLPAGRHRAGAGLALRPRLLSGLVVGRGSDRGSRLGGRSKGTRHSRDSRGSRRTLQQLPLRGQAARERASEPWLSSMQQSCVCRCAVGRRGGGRGGGTRRNLAAGNLLHRSAQN